jgi:alpha,alpha-trehalase
MSKTGVPKILALCLPLSLFSCDRQSVEPFGNHPVTVQVRPIADRLVYEEDTDGDKKITVKDRPTGEPGRGDKRFLFAALDDREYVLEGVYHISNLLQELKFAEVDGLDRVELQPERIVEPPTARISRLIRERYWDGLTRRIDADHLDAIVGDEKIENGVVRNFYLAHDDPDVLGYFDGLESGHPGVRLRVVRLPGSYDPGAFDDLLEAVLEEESTHPGSLHYIFLPTDGSEGIRRIESGAAERSELRLRVQTLPAEIPRDLLECVLKSPTNGNTDRRDASYLYVPGGDAGAWEYFRAVAIERSELRLEVERLPMKITPAYVEALRGRHGLLSLALGKQDGRWVGLPFVVPGGRFNEMYGWDSYFEAEGLLRDDRVDLARAMVDNFVYQIRHYGKILNANRSYYLTRSQPPFLTSMALAVYERLDKDERSRRWLAETLWAAIEEYENVWVSPERVDKETGLSRYCGTGLGQPPEVEPGHFDDVYERLAAEIGLVGPELECEYFVHDRCMRESGHDTTYRWDVDGNRCADFVTVDLNSLLYKVELDLARTIEQEFGGELKNDDGRISSSQTWKDRARRRRQHIRKHLWDRGRSLFFDYHRTTGARHTYVSATTFYPLWAWDGENRSTSILEEDEIKSFVEVAVGLLRAPGGILASTEASRGPLSNRRKPRQWDYPNGWAPHQMITWEGLRSHGYDEIAQDLIYRWLYTITRNAVDYNGTIPEKFDVVERSHQVFGEYGNVGTKFEYITQEGFGWMNASYQVGLAMLNPEYREQLDRLVPPEELFKR